MSLALDGQHQICTLLLATYCHCVCPSCLVLVPTSVAVLASCLLAAVLSYDHHDSYLQAVNWPTVYMHRHHRRMHIKICNKVAGTGGH